MTTAKEFTKAGITGHTLREITEKFGKPWSRVAEEDPLMANYCLAFAWFRERERLQIDAAYDKALGLSSTQIQDLFEDDKEPAKKAAVDFVSQPSTTTP